MLAYINTIEWGVIHWLYVILLVINIVTYIALGKILYRNEKSTDPKSEGYFELKFSIRFLVSIGTVLIVLIAGFGYNYETMLKRLKDQHDEVFMSLFHKRDSLDKAFSGVQKDFEAISQDYPSKVKTLKKLEDDIVRVRNEYYNSGAYYVTLNISADSLFKMPTIKYSELPRTGREFPVKFDDAPFILVSAETPGALVNVLAVSKTEFQLGTNTSDLPSDRIVFTLMIVPRSKP